MAADGFSSELARETAPEALERFLRYVVVDTASDPRSRTYPSRPEQLELSRMLASELLELGLADAHLDEHGYVLATLPATVEHEVPTIGLVAHVDTYPGVPGAGVRPRVVTYEGGRLSLGDSGEALDPEESPDLPGCVGHRIVTSDGTTLLGADDKAGVAEIMAALAYLVRHPELPHGPVRVAFTPDEEIGKGTDHFDVEAFGAVAAYTLDGSGLGELEDETFSALQARVTFRGHVVHPGTAKGVMVNATRLAADFVARLPRDAAPETTEGREGFVHPTNVEGNDDCCEVLLILRAFDEEELAAYEALVRRLAAEVVAAHARASARVEVARQYSNMKRFLEREPRAVPFAEEAIRRAGVEPVRSIVRGGTDGSRLSELGLPTPNLFTGGRDYHSFREWVCVHDMGAAVATIVHLVQVWAEEGAT